MPTLARPLLSVRELRRPGLEAANFVVAAGECVAISGSSGSGKTLLLRAIADLDPNDGAVFLDGQPRSDFTAPEWRRQVAYAAAESGWWEDRVGDHFPPPANGMGTLLTAVGLPEESLTWPVARLSSGERQRLALVRLLCRKPRVLLLDEPTSALDQTAVARIEALLHGVLRAGGGIVVVSHDPQQVARLARVHLTMHEGRLSEADAKVEMA